MAAEEAESADFRGAQRQALAEFSAEVRAAEIAALAEDRQMLADEIAERDATFNAFLDGELDQVQADMLDCLEIFRLALKELYNYIEVEQYNVEENLRVAPYTQYQHKNFLHKFGFWLADQLAALDA